MKKQNMHNRRKFGKSFEDRRDRMRERDSEAKKKKPGDGYDVLLAKSIPTTWA